MDRQIDKQIDRYMDGWIDRQKDKKINGWDGQIDKWMDGWMDTLQYFFNLGKFKSEECLPKRLSGLRNFARPVHLSN